MQLLNPMKGQKQKHMLYIVKDIGGQMEIV